MPVLGAGFCRFDNVLGGVIADRLLQETCAAWSAASRGAADHGGRESEWCVPFDRLRVPVLEDAVARWAPTACAMLGFDIGDGALAYNFVMFQQGGRRPRPDAGWDGAVTDRDVSFVYQLYRRPRAFTGGGLRIFDLTVADGRPGCADSFREIAPRHDSIVFFPSVAWHEIEQVSCEGRDLLDGYFSFHGWLP
ncbi:2OG-Fe(II) oxygenase [Nocardia sp. CS682]|uniref:2OG-Fe(II) oxygenase family protein n=1 Tax=Nocardia sp. CS682 TaxID=1047172 RepID=UPI0014320A36|nr:2OG-Fe(II) oxygenase [Nocardia sp. CS682]